MYIAAAVGIMIILITVASMISNHAGFTSNLKELSGAVLHKTVFAFRLAYITEIEKHLGIKLPIILDSPSGKEVDQVNIQLMVNILKRDFAEVLSRVMRKFFHRHL